MTSAPVRDLAVSARRLAERRIADIPESRRPWAALGGGVVLFVVAFLVVFGLPGSTLGMFMTVYGLLALLGGVVVVAIAYEHQQRQRARRARAATVRRRRPRQL